MKAPRSLQGRIALWSGALFFLLYAAASLLVIAIDSRNHRAQMEVMLYSAAESLAGYYASSHRLDFPELRELETTPLPVWVRIVRDGRVVAETPGAPHLPVVARSPGEMGHVQTAENGNGTHLAVVPHDVWNEPGTIVEAIASQGTLDERHRDLLFALAVTGLLLVPLVALGGRMVAAQGLRPLDDLVVSIRQLHSERLRERLEAPGAVEEIAHLADEFNRLLDRLEESVESMRRFTADASHELRTPISILRTGLEVALRKERPAEEYRELMRENLAEIQRVQRIVEALLTLARTPDGERRQALRGPVDLASVVSGAVEAIRPLAEERRLRIVECLAPAATVHGDADLLRLMAMNLLDNAVKFTPEGRRVHVTVEDGPDGAVRLQVRDEGPGIALQDRPYVFDRFFRGQGRSAGSAAGGLGLSLVRWVAESHGGEARLVQNDIAGKAGATFEVVIPRPTAAPPPPAAEAARH
ncbi:MAG TPA: ATP-binding protein [Thermoanaerobaculia bacterium]|jgi:two-component system OmpR family sensor kinase|nr:ATP-binding protein [Thermoanaerobaculia bacterium]